MRKHGLPIEAKAVKRSIAMLDRPEVSEERVIGFIYSQGGEATFGELMQNFDLGRSLRKGLDRLLADLCDAKLLALTEDGNFTIKRSHDLVEGIISAHPRGFAFASVPNPPPGLALTGDLFIPASALAPAMHGDRVLLRITGSRPKGLEAKVLQVLARGADSIVGIFRAGASGGGGLVVPEDERYPYTIVVRPEHCLNAKNGEAVVALITDPITPDDPRNLKGKVVEVLGDPDSFTVQTEMVIRKLDLPHLFSPQVEQQVAAIDSAVLPAPGRTDLRAIFHITIDGETARDFDDAVAVIKSAKGYRLYVSIADVSHYVVPDSPLDREAYQRGTSVYFPTRVLPMLPEQLSNNLCSLVPDQDRYTFTAILDFDSSGQLLNKEFCKSLIRSRYRMTYNQVSEMLVDKEPELCRRYADLLPSLVWMGELGAQLGKQRDERGSIGFEIPEANIEIGDHDQVAAITHRERNPAHHIIEEFMLAANEAVARTLADHQPPFAFFRIHDKPDPLRVEEFTEFASSMGLKMPKADSSPRWFGEVLKLVAGTPQEYIINNLLLRTMRQACYSPENSGHFGLAADYYTHFTSPIRRYPDLLVHRSLNGYLQGLAGKTAAVPRERMPPVLAPAAVTPKEAGEFLSKRERVAVEAEREMLERLKVRFMADKVGDTFSAIVSGATPFGLFVELLEFFISGAIPITALKSDHFHHDEKKHRLIGERTHTTYQLGDLITVELESVEVSRRRINFILARAD